ncbi:hypothetical protein V7183_21000 [Bacillus sp. JJ1127]|uniref:hypothetical protein n=1 Tax=Bacillus sp. JJ1127 TaxID=3122952 RepID=UPI002FFFB947
MKGSEAILRAMHQAGGEIPATQFDTWLGLLSQLGLLEQVTKDDNQVFYYWLTDSAKQFLAKKGVRN